MPTSAIRVFFIFLAFAAGTGMATAQWALGVRAGANASTMDFSNNPEYRLEGPSYTQGLMFGLTAQYISQPHVGVQFEANYTQKGWSEKEDTVTGIAYKRRITYVELPFLAHVYIGKRKFRMIFDFGPYGALALSARETVRDMNSGAEQKTDYAFDDERDNRLDYGLILGSGFEYQIGRATLQIAARYTFGFGNINRVKTTESEASQNRAISLSAGFLFAFGQEKKSSQTKASR